MLIQDTIFYRPDWRWHNFLKYLTSNLSKYDCLEKIIPLEYSYKDSTYECSNNYLQMNGIYYLNLYQDLIYFLYI